RALIAARLDTLPAERKGLLQDAAVIGKVFWSGALAEMGKRDRGDIARTLHELSRKELVRPARVSSMEGEEEYGFAHVLIRDVCADQTPGADRGARRVSAAEWMENKAGDRAEDLADVLAHHYLPALDLARAVGARDEIPELETKASRCLLRAGERALALDVSTAETHFAKALALTPADHPDRPAILEHWAYVAQQQQRMLDAKAAYEEAIALALDRGGRLVVGRAMTGLVLTLWAIGDATRQDVLAEAISLLETQPPGPELVRAYGELAGAYAIDGAARDAVAAADRSLALAAS